MYRSLYSYNNDNAILDEFFRPPSIGARLREWRAESNHYKSLVVGETDLIRRQLVYGEAQVESKTDRADFSFFLPPSPCIGDKGIRLAFECMYLRVGWLCIQRYAGATRESSALSPFLSLSYGYGRRGRALRVVALILGLE